MRRLALLLVPLFVTACAVSVQPFYRMDQLTFDSTLLGAWGEPNTSEGVVLRADRGHYEIDYTDSNGKHARFVGLLFHWAGRTALDVSPAERPDSVGRQIADPYWGLLIPGHTVFWLDHAPDRISFTSLDADTLKAYLTAHPDAVEHVLGNSGPVLLAAPPRLQAFLGRYLLLHPLGEPTVWHRRGGPRPGL